MSVCATRWAWSIPKQEITASEKIVLLSLADRADERHICFPSQKRLEKDTCLERKTIIRAIKSLVEKGFITVLDQKFGRIKRVNIYKLNFVSGRDDEYYDDGENYTIPDDFDDSANNGTIKKQKTVNRKNDPDSSANNGTSNTPKKPKNDYNSTDNGTFNDANNGIQNLSSEADNNNLYIAHLQDEQDKGISSEKSFEVFWSAWPSGRKQGKAKALKIWKREKYTLKDAEMMAADIHNRLQNCDKWANGYIPEPPTYLNNQRWEDDLRPRKKTPEEAKRDLEREKHKAMLREEAAKKAKEREIEEARLAKRAITKGLASQTLAGILKHVGSPVAQAREKELYDNSATN